MLVDILKYFHLIKINNDNIYNVLLKYVKLGLNKMFIYFKSHVIT